MQCGGFADGVERGEEGGVGLRTWTRFLVIVNAIAVGLDIHNHHYGYAAFFGLFIVIIISDDLITAVKSK